MQDTYKFNREEPAVCVELYLPKKPAFQRILHDTLTKGFDFGSVKTHMISKKDEIQHLFRHRNLPAELYDLDLIEYMNGMFCGYSMYEVDGVFVGEPDEPYTERTQVVRMLFRPKYDKLKEQFGETIYTEALNYFQDSSFVLDREIDKRNKATLHIQQWSKALLLFVYGYIVLNISEEIKKFAVKEEEIWVVSSWNQLINRILLTGGIYSEVRNVLYYDWQQGGEYYRMNKELDKAVKVDLTYGQLDDVIFDESGENKIDPEIVDLVDESGQLRLRVEDVTKLTLVLIEQEPNNRFEDLVFDDFVSFTILKYPSEEQGGLLYCFGFDRDCTFNVTGRKVKDPDSFYNQICKDPENKALREELVKKSKKH